MTIDTSEPNKRLLQEKETSPKCCPSPPKRKAMQEHHSSPQSLESRQLDGPSKLDITTSTDRTDRRTRTFTHGLKCDTTTPSEHDQSKQGKYNSETEVAEAGKWDSPAVVVAAKQIATDSSSASWDSFLSLAAVAAELSDSKDYEHPHRPVTPPIYAATFFENKAPLTVAPGYALKAGLRLDLGETKDGQAETKAKCSTKSKEDYSCSPLASRLSKDFSSKLHCASSAVQANMAAIATVASPIRATTRKRGSSRLKKGRSSSGAMVSAGGTSSVRDDAEKFKNFNLLELAVEQFTKASSGSTSEGNVKNTGNNNTSSDSENDGYFVFCVCVCVACFHFMFLLTSPCTNHPFTLLCIHGIFGSNDRTKDTRHKTHETKAIDTRTARTTTQTQDKTKTLINMPHFGCCVYHSSQCTCHNQGQERA